jgi:phenylalanyl-tRNA synthetase beta subunit
MYEKLPIRCSNGANDPIVIRTATGEVGMLTEDNALYVRAVDVNDLCAALQRAAKELEVETE